MDARVGPDGLAELADFEAEGGLLEGPLHGAAAEGAQVAAFFRRRTVGELGRQFGERRPAADDLLAVARQQRRRLVRRSEPKKKTKKKQQQKPKSFQDRVFSGPIPFTISDDEKTSKTRYTHSVSTPDPFQLVECT